MEIRKNVKLEGIPIVWHTNLSDEDIKQLYEVVRNDPEFTKCKAQIKIGVGTVGSSFGVKITIPKLYSSTIPLKEGWCSCTGLQNCLRVIYRSAHEWELWDAHKREVRELREERDTERQINELLFRAEDEHLAQVANEMIDKSEFDAAANVIHRRLLHAEETEKKNMAEGFRHFKVVYQTRRDSLRTLLRFPTTAQASRFLGAHTKFWWDYFAFAESWYSANRDAKNGPVEETDKIFRAAVEKFPIEGKLYKKICLFWAHKKQIGLAIEYCSLACKRGVLDDTKRGFPFRLKKLLKRAEFMKTKES